MSSLFFLLLFGGPVSEVGRFAMPLQADSARDGLRLLYRAQEAMGGAKKLSLVKDTIHVMEITLEPAAGGYKLTQISKYIAPNHFRQEQETPFGRIVV
jgi:hypothetical protein